MKVCIIGTGAICGVHIDALKAHGEEITALCDVDTAKAEAVREKYGLKYQLLHSWKAVFPELTGTLSDLSGKTFTAPLPSSVRRILQGEHLTGEGL